MRMRRFVVRGGVTILLTTFSFIVGGVELFHYYKPPEQASSSEAKPMQFSNVKSIEIIQTPADLTIRYRTRDGQMMPLSFPGVTDVVMKDLRPLAEKNGKGKK